MRNLVPILLLAACGSKPAPAPVAKKTAPPPAEHEVDRDLYPASYPTLQLAERAESEPEREKLARRALVQLDEERSLGGKSTDRDRAYERIHVRARIAIDSSLIARGRSIEVLADLVRPLACPTAPQRAVAACESLMAALGAAFPNAVGRGKVMLLDEAIVEEMTDELSKRAAQRPGVVVQRMRVTSKAKGVLKVGKTIVRVDPMARVNEGDVAWIAFEARAMKRVGATFDVAGAHVLHVEPAVVAKP